MQSSRASPLANRLEMFLIRTHPFAALVFFFFLFCLKRMFSIPSSPVHPKWVTINGPIVKVSGCSSSSRGLQTQIGEEGEREREKKGVKWELNSSAHCFRVWKMAPWQPRPATLSQWRAEGRETGTLFLRPARSPCRFRCSTGSRRCSESQPRERFDSCNTSSFSRYWCVFLFFFLFLLQYRPYVTPAPFIPLCALQVSDCTFLTGYTMIHVCSAINSFAWLISVQLYKFPDSIWLQIFETDTISLSLCVWSFAQVASKGSGGHDFKITFLVS